MRKSKKGFTLVELVCGIVIMGVAIIAGVAVFAVGARSYVRGVKLAQSTGEIQQYFNTGTQPAAVTKAMSNENIVIQFGTVKVELKDKAFIKSTATNDNVSAGLSVWMDSIND